MKNKLKANCKHFWLPLRTIHYKKWEKKHNKDTTKYGWVSCSDVELVYCAKCGESNYVDLSKKL